MFKCQHEDRSHINLFFFYSATHHNHLLRMAAQEQDLCPNKEALEKYPKNTKPLENQVAGHSFSDGCHTIGMLRDEDGHVLKPVNKPEQGRKEIEFYETLSKYETDDILQLKQFVPQYFGSVILSIDGRSAQFLKLLDATRGYKKPCVMDVKIGRQTWEPGAPVEKQLREEVLLRSTERIMGDGFKEMTLYMFSRSFSTVGQNVEESLRRRCCVK
ncbi:inositol polyphosphate multikinase-like isoform X4 [Macrosteles quadrilineatus]|uniref:inositol polyphosphate multikinase-like isoform X4 n=1 Tax=Macrosteles quadrilineatus TaxID=74068 RepID=UPI0023E20114|nr:inositol polyphosphate multikinase-like isoform X4 [Macrosteles quadrilineatus]